MDTSATNYAHMLPEIIVALTGAAILIVDLIKPAERRGAPYLAYLGIAGLGLAGVSVASLAGTSATLFSGIYVVDGLATFFKILFLAIGILVLLLSVDSLGSFSPHAAEFHALIVWCTLGHMVLASAAELFTIFLALQLTSLPLIVLIGYAKSERRSSEASLKYLVLVLVSTAVLLYGMTLIYGAVGTSTLSDIGATLLAEQHIQPVVALGLVLLLTGFAFKITAAPFHFWAPDVYEGAPAPVTAFLSVGSKFAGFALALRIIVTGAQVPVDWHLIFGVMATISMTLGNVAAIPQTNIKRMLAYSGIAQAGYLLVGMAAMNVQGMTGLLFYAVAYTVANLTAFGVVIFVAHRTGSEQIADYAGLSRRAPLAAFALAAALLSLGGLPLLAGFMAKFYIFLFAVKAGLAWLVAIAVINSVISVYYYLRVLWVMYVQQSDGPELAVPPRIGAALSFSAVSMAVLGLWPGPLIDAAHRAASALFGS
jgi:NADH-quinone oxidoreductase subunit N